MIGNEGNDKCASPAARRHPPAARQCARAAAKPARRRALQPTNTPLRKRRKRLA